MRDPALTALSDNDLAQAIQERAAALNEGIIEAVHQRGLKVELDTRDMTRVGTPAPLVKVEVSKPLGAR